MHDLELEGRSRIFSSDTHFHELSKLIGGNAIMKRCVQSLERDIGKDDEFWESGGSEFQSRGPMTEETLLPSDDRTYGMERSNESEDLVEAERGGNE